MKEPFSVQIGEKHTQAIYGIDLGIGQKVYLRLAKHIPDLDTTV